MEHSQALHCLKGLHLVLRLLARTAAQHPAHTITSSQWKGGGPVIFPGADICPS
jgi:hypothetical protein